MSTHPILFHRSGATTDWTCPRKRYWNYEAEGRGLTPPETAYELYLGTLIHDGIAALSHHISIDAIVDAGVTQLRAKLLEGRERDSDAQFLADEQCALAEGLLRGFYRARWPAICAEYPTLVLCEQEIPYDYEVDGVPLRFLAKPDLVRRDTDGQLWYFEWKTTSSNKEEWIHQWETAIQLHSSVRAVEQALKEPVTGVIVQGFYKSYVSQYRRLESAFCLTPDTKVLTSDLRYIPIGEVPKGAMLAGFDEHPAIDHQWEKPRRYWRNAEVLNTQRIKQPCLKLTFEDGRTVTCSRNHLWLTSTNKSGCNSADTQWRVAGSLTAGKSRIINLLPVWDSPQSFEDGYLAGLFDGEGHISYIHPSNGLPNAVVGFSQKAGPILEDVYQQLLRRGLRVLGPYKDESRSASHLTVSKKSDVIRLLGSVRPRRLLSKFSFDRLGSLTQHQPPVLVTNIEDMGELEVIAIETSTKTLVAEGLASHNCYGYHHPGNPPFERPRWSYEYKAGLRKYPIWQRDGGVKQWVEEMPMALLASQFPSTPPIFVKDHMVDAFLYQQGRREIAIRQAREAIAAGDRSRLDETFPQHFESCNAWNRPCGYQRLCFGAEVNPLEIGYTLRQSHHQMEQDQWEPTGGQ